MLPLCPINYYHLMHAARSENRHHFVTTSTRGPPPPCCGTPIIGPYACPKALRQRTSPRWACVLGGLPTPLQRGRRRLPERRQSPRNRACRPHSHACSYALSYAFCSVCQAGTRFPAQHGGRLIPRTHAFSYAFSYASGPQRAHSAALCVRAPRCTRQAQQPLLTAMPVQVQGLFMSQRDLVARPHAFAIRIRMCYEFCFASPSGV